MWSKFSKIFHTVGAVAAAVVSMGAAGVVAVPSKVVAVSGVVAYLAGAVGKALFGDKTDK